MALWRTSKDKKGSLSAPAFLPLSYLALMAKGIEIYMTRYSFIETILNNANVNINPKNRLAGNQQSEVALHKLLKNHPWCEEDFIKIKNPPIGQLLI